MDQAVLIDTIAKTPEYMTTAIGAVGVIGGALIGVVSGFLTAWITNRHGRKLLARQLESESRERQRERQVNLRRDVYLPAADAVVSLSVAMGRMAGGDRAAAEQLMDVIQAFGSALTRMQMVATPETIRHVAGYQRATLKTVSFLQRQNHSLMLIRVDIDIAAEARDSHMTERTKLVEMMKAYNIDGGRDLARFERIQQQDALAEHERAEAHREWLRHVHAFETTRLEMIREYINHLTELSQLQAPVLAAIRRELETGEDSHALIAEEAERTAAVGLQGIREQIPLIEAGIERIRTEIAADEQQEKKAPAARHRGL